MTIKQRAYAANILPGIIGTRQSQLRVVFSIETNHHSVMFLLAKYSAKVRIFFVAFVHIFAHFEQHHFAILFGHNHSVLVHPLGVTNTRLEVFSALHAAQHQDGTIAVLRAQISVLGGQMSYEAYPVLVGQVAGRHNQLSILLKFK